MFQANKKTPTKRKKKGVAEDIKDEMAPSENKRSRRTKSTKSDITEVEKCESNDISDEVNDGVGGKKTSKAKKTKSGKLEEGVSTKVEELSDDVKNRLQNGRLTRGKIKEIAEVIENTSEMKTSSRKKRVVKKEIIRNKTEAEKDCDDFVKDDKLLNVCNGMHKDNCELPVNGTVKIEENNDEDTGEDVTLVLSARTKLKARTGKSVKNGADTSHRGRALQREKLKTPRKKSLKRLSTSKVNCGV